MESNLDIKTPKLNVQNVSSAILGKDGGSNGSIKNIHGTISKLAGHVRKAVIRIGALEKRVDSQEEKTTKIINILKTQKSNVGGKIPATGGQNNLEKELAEVNKTLVEVQKELQKYFSFQAKTDKEEKEKTSRDESRKRLKAEESQLKKSSKNLGSQVKKRSEEIVKPTRGIFDSIMDFVGTMALGIGSNAIFEWLKDEENRKKVEGWFTWIKDHWQWVAGALGIMLALPLVGAITGIVGVIGTLASVLGLVVGPLLALLASPITWAILGVAAGTFALGKAMEWGMTEAQKRQYGEGNVKKGIFATKLGDHYGRIATQRERDKMTPQEKSDAAKISLYDTLLSNRQVVNDNLWKARENLKTYKGSTSEGMYQKEVDRLEKEIRIKDRHISDAENQTKIQGQTLGELFEVYSKTGVLPSTSLSKRLYKRERGGPVTRNESYLVGEKGPELFIPNINGSIVNNHRTEKIYQMITSKKRGRGGVNITTLPMQTEVLPPPEMKMGTSGMPSTDVPDISSVNMADPYRSVVSRNILGITV